MLISVYLDVTGNSVAVKLGNPSSFPVPIVGSVLMCRGNFRANSTDYMVVSVQWDL